MNCKPGDMAIVTGWPPNNGIICKVEYYTGNKYVPKGWACVSEGRLFFDRGGIDSKAIIQDSCLRPVSGLYDPDSIDTTHPLDAELLARSGA